MMMMIYKCVKTPMKDPPKSNPSKRHRERLNSELDHLASLLPFNQSVISKLDKLSILRLSVSYLRTKSYFQAVLRNKPYSGYETHLNHHLYPESDFSEGNSTLQALNGFLAVVSCDSEVFFASKTVEQYLGFHQSDIIHQSVLELIHSEDREEFKKQLTWNSQLPSDKSNITLPEALQPENVHLLHRSFTVRFRCLLDNTSGFITLEISGWLKLLHGQNVKGDNTPLALFAVCCPFGPLPMLDVPARDYTFKTKHKMDLTPTHMDHRGKLLFGYTDSDFGNIGGYDLIHPDDLKYYSEAHQELMKTGNSGLIAYRLMTKDFKWLWLQSSCKIVYKNSKPDFILTTHRHLTDDEGHELFGKRGSEFKLPYPIVDMDYPNGFDVEYEEDANKTNYHPSSSPGSKTKKTSKTQLRDYLQTSRKRKVPYRDLANGYTYSYPGCENGAKQPSSDLVYSYGSNNFGLDSDLYRSHSYHQLFSGSLYSNSADPYTEKHSYSNGYYPYTQHSLQYSGNGYSDIVAPSPKYNYDTSKYGYDVSGSFTGSEFSKTRRVEDEFNKYNSSVSSDYLPDKYLPSRLNSFSDSLRSSNLYSSSSYLSADSLVPSITPQHSSSTSSSCSVFGGDTTPTTDQTSTVEVHQRSTVDLLLDRDNNNVKEKMYSESSQERTIISHGTVIIHPKSKPAGQSGDVLTLSTSSASSPIQNSGSLTQSGSSAWTACSRLNSISKSVSPHQDANSVSPVTEATIVSPASQHSAHSPVLSSLSNASPIPPNTSATVIQSTACSSEQKQSPMAGSIAVPVVKSPSWLHKDWSTLSSDSFNQRNGFTTDLYTKMTPWDSKMSSFGNPLLSFSEVTHALIGE